jgi:HSP20 family protein
MKHGIFGYIDHLLSVAGHSLPQAGWRPAADVYRCRHGWLLKFDLAGVRPEDIEVRIDGRKVIVSGTRRDWRMPDVEEAHMMEIAYSHFKRSVELLDDIGRSEIQREYRDGMLLVHLLIPTSNEPDRPAKGVEA